MIKKTFCEMINRYDIMQRAMVDIVIDAPDWIAKIFERILSHSERGSGMLEDVRVYRKLSNDMRVHHACELLAAAGFKPRVDRVSNYCIWIGEEKIDFLFDVMNGEPKIHPEFLPAHERNIDALVDAREVRSIISTNKKN